jgi:general secretion pathway protein J
MSRPSGFTLLELLVAILLTSVVALLVYGIAQAGLDTETHLVSSTRSVQSARAMRTLLEEALRNVRPALNPGDPAFILESRTTKQGRPLDQLSFVTAGSLPPLTTEADWAVTVEATAAGLALSATPLGVRSPQQVTSVQPGITGLRVRVQVPGDESDWIDTWALRTLLPRAVELTFWSDSGPSRLPLRVLLPLRAGS